MRKKKPELVHLTDGTNKSPILPANLHGHQGTAGSSSGAALCPGPRSALTSGVRSGGERGFQGAGASSCDVGVFFGGKKPRKHEEKTCDEENPRSLVILLGIFLVTNLGLDLFDGHFHWENDDQLSLSSDEFTWLLIKCKIPVDAPSP